MLAAAGMLDVVLVLVLVGLVLVLVLVGVFDDAYASQANNETRLRMSRQKWTAVDVPQKGCNNLDDAEMRGCWRRALRDVAVIEPIVQRWRGGHRHALQESVCADDELEEEQEQLL